MSAISGPSDGPVAVTGAAGFVDMTAAIMESCRKAGTVKRVIYTSSVAAIFGPGGPDRPDDYIFTEDDWCGGT